jgi:hypothetical protein
VARLGSIRRASDSAFDRAGPGIGTSGRPAFSPRTVKLLKVCKSYLKVRVHGFFV